MCTLRYSHTHINIRTMYSMTLTPTCTYILCTQKRSLPHVRTYGVLKDTHTHMYVHMVYSKTLTPTCTYIWCTQKRSLPHVRTYGVLKDTHTHIRICTYGVLSDVHTHMYVLMVYSMMLIPTRTYCVLSDVYTHMYKRCAHLCSCWIVQKSLYDTGLKALARDFRSQLQRNSTPVPVPLLLDLVDLQPNEGSQHLSCLALTSIHAVHSTCVVFLYLCVC